MNATSQPQAQAAAPPRSRITGLSGGVIAQDQAAMQSIAQQLRKAADDKLRARAEQYQQNESDLSLQARAATIHGSAWRSSTQLNTVALSADQRKSVTDQLAALDEGSRAVNQLRAPTRRRCSLSQRARRANLGADPRAAVDDPVADRRQAQRSGGIRSGRSCGGSGPPVADGEPAAGPAPAVSGRFIKNTRRNSRPTRSRRSKSTKRPRAISTPQFAALHGQGVGATGAAAKQLRDLQKRYRRSADAHLRPDPTRSRAARQGDGILRALTTSKLQTAATTH